MVNEKDLGIISKIGGREQNQDYALAYKGAKGTLLVLCDGAGGYNGGAFASKWVANYIINSFRSYNGEIEIKEFLIKLIIDSNQQLIEQSNENSELSGMKTTLAMMYIHGDKGISFHLGDSRIYQIRNGRIIFRTKDHSYVQELLDANKISKKDMHKHPKSNVITRALGATLKIEIEVKDLKIKQNDIVLLTSDGVHGLLSDNHILATVNENDSVGKICERLSDLSEIEGIKTKNSKHDNLTVVIFSKEFEKLKFIFKYKELIVGIAFCGLLFLSYWILKRDKKPLPNIESITHYPNYLDCNAMDSIMRIDSINIIKLHKDSFDKQIIESYKIKHTYFKDSIILTKLK